jgi:apolipoprotein N-acyltransferase
MRATENRRWIVLATNDGITATIDPAGRVYRNLPSYQAAAARTGYSYIQDATFYSRHGDWFVLLCAILAAVALADVVRGYGRGIGGPGKTAPFGRGAQ